MRNNMVKEAQVILAQAELEGDQIIRGAHDRVIQLQEEIQGLKQERIRLTEELRAVLRTYLAMLEAGDDRRRQDDAAVIANNLRIMAPGARKRAAD